jgi:Tol biopolymer transport system component
VAYVTFPEGILWRANRDGSNPTRLTDPPLYPTSPNWSPDGTQILFSSADAAGSPKGYLISSEGGIPRSLIPGNMDEQGNPNWSPDGRKIAFDSWETAGENSRHVIRILDLAGHQITTLPGEVWSPRWSPDSRFLAALTHDTSNLTVFDFETRRWTMLQKGPTGYPTWSRDSQFLYFLRPEHDPEVYRIRISGGEAARVFDLKGFRHTGVYLNWMGLDPQNAPLLLRDAGGDDIYSLTLEQK